MSQDPGEAAGKFLPGSTALSRTSKAEIGYKGHLRLSTEQDDLELKPAEIPPLVNFLLDQSQHPKQQERLNLLKEHIEKGEATRTGAETILFDIMVTFLPTTILRQVQEIYALLNARMEQEEEQ
jgi:hypothetical protein